MISETTLNQDPTPAQAEALQSPEAHLDQLFAEVRRAIDECVPINEAIGLARGICGAQRESRPALRDQIDVEAPALMRRLVAHLNTSPPAEIRATVSNLRRLWSCAKTELLAVRATIRSARSSSLGSRVPRVQTRRRGCGQAHGGRAPPEGSDGDDLPSAGAERSVAVSAPQASSPSPASREALEPLIDPTHFDLDLSLRLDQALGDGA